MSKMKAQSPSRVALVYDRVNTWGGAERVLQALHEIYPESTLFTSVYDASGAPWAHGWKVVTSWLQFFPWARTHHRFFGWLMPWLFEGFDFSEFDLVISVSSEAAKAVRTKPGQLHVCYMLTPTRYLWSHQESHLQQLPLILQPLARLIMRLLQRVDRYQSSRPDVFVAISQVVAQRVQNSYGRSCSAIIAPPLVELHPALRPTRVPTRPFFFSWGRLVSYKKFDESLRAAVAAKKLLLIAGEGPERARLTVLADHLDPEHQYIEFLGSISEAELHWYLNHAQAALFPQLEDFGISTLEALLCGCSVVVNQASGVSELLLKAPGVFFLNDEKSESIEKILRRFPKRSGSRLDIQETAQQYAGARFAQQWEALIQKLRKEEI